MAAAWQGVPQQAAWRGGCVLAGLSAFQNEIVTIEDYDEAGPGIVNKMNILRYN